MAKNSMNLKMRELHRYLGFFLAGIMAVYAVSGITLIFRKGDTFKKEVVMEKTLEPGLTIDKIGPAIKIKNLKADRTEGSVIYFEGGSYDATSGATSYTAKQVPYLLDKMQHMHKATTGDPLFYLNIFFGLSLLFFVISAFWMFLPSSSTFRKGLYFTLGGMVLVLVMLFV